MNESHKALRYRPGHYIACFNIGSDASVTEENLFNGRWAQSRALVNSNNDILPSLDRASTVSMLGGVLSSSLFHASLATRGMDNDHSYGAMRVTHVDFDDGMLLASVRMSRLALSIVEYEHSCPTFAHTPHRYALSL